MPPKSLKHQKLPVSNKYFPSIKLTESQIVKCHEFASKLLTSYQKAEYDERMGRSKKKWQYLTDKNGVNSYMCNGSVHCSWHFKFEAKVQGSVRDILDGLYCDTTEEFRDMCEHVHEEKLVDCSVLGILKNREENNSDCFTFLGFKWKGFAPVAPNVEARDYCLLEYSGITTDANGDEFGFRIFESVNISECPSQYDSLGFVRGRMSRCCLYRDGPERGMVQVLVLGYYDPCAVCDKWKNYRSYLIQKSMVNLAACVVNIPTCIEAKTISSRMFLPKSEWVDNKDRKECFLCQKKFNIIRHRHHCRVCGEVMCRNCSVQKTFRYYNNGATKVDYVRVCKRCKGNAKTAPTKKATNSFATDSSSSSSMVEHEYLGNIDSQRDSFKSFSSDEVFQDGVFTLGCDKASNSSSFFTRRKNESSHESAHDNYSDKTQHLSKNQEDKTFQQITKTLAEQEMLLEAMKNAASKFNCDTSNSTHLMQSKDQQRFELLK